MGMFFFYKDDPLVVFIAVFVTVFLYSVFCMNRVDIAMGLLDRVKMVVVVVSVDVVANVVNVVDFFWVMLTFVVNVVVICLSTPYTGLTSRWGCWTRRRWSSSTSPLSRSSSSSVSTLALS